jgi:pyruvate/2-oxoglutarate dehydrogenase complex dihydrolipoamide acyltransferase (E2) component
MASLIGLIDEGVEPATDGVFELLPAGEYVGQIIEFETKPTASGAGTYIKLTWELLNDGCKGRRVWQNINVRNENQKAQEIGQGEFAAIMKHTGLSARDDSSAYLNRPVGLVLKIEKSKNPRYPDDRNAVDKFFNANDFVVGGRKPKPAAAAAPTATPAWAKPASERQPEPAQAQAQPTEPAPAAQAPATPAANAPAATPPWMKKAA